MYNEQTFPSWHWNIKMFNFHGCVKPYLWNNCLHILKGKPKDIFLTTPFFLFLWKCVFALHFVSYCCMRQHSYSKGLLSKLFIFRFWRWLFLSRSQLLEPLLAFFCLLFSFSCSFCNSLLFFLSLFFPTSRCLKEKYFCNFQYFPLPSYIYILFWPWTPRLTADLRFYSEWRGFYNPSSIFSLALHLLRGSLHVFSLGMLFPNTAEFFPSLLLLSLSICLHLSLLFNSIVTGTMYFCVFWWILWNYFRNYFRFWGGPENLDITW